MINSHHFNKKNNYLNDKKLTFLPVVGAKKNFRIAEKIVEL
jgi:hypothetical protein